MANISSELETIEVNNYGEPVLSAITSSLNKLNNGADIASELYTITNGRYGSDIRMAIHDALYKVNENGGSGEDFDKIGIAYGSSNYLNECIIGIAEEYEE